MKSQLLNNKTAAIASLSIVLHSKPWPPLLKEHRVSDSNSNA